MSKQTLLPCPFCGGDNLSMWAYSTSPECYVKCKDCSATITLKVPWGVGLTEAQHDDLCAEVLIKTWNTRKGKQKYE